MSNPRLEPNPDHNPPSRLPLGNAVAAMNSTTTFNSHHHPNQAQRVKRRRDWQKAQEKVCLLSRFSAVASSGGLCRPPTVSRSVEKPDVLSPTKPLQRREFLPGFKSVAPIPDAPPPCWKIVGLFGFMRSLLTRAQHRAAWH